MNNFPKLFEAHYSYLLQEVLSSIDDAVLIFDYRHIIVYANGASEDIFGVTQHEIVGTSIKQLMPKDKVSLL